jgi:hypothetical protein
MRRPEISEIRQLDDIQLRGAEYVAWSRAYDSAQYEITRGTGTKAETHISFLLIRAELMRRIGHPEEAERLQRWADGLKNK